MALLTTLFARWDRLDRAGDPLLVHGDSTLDRRALRARAERASGWLRDAGVRSGEVIATRLPKCVEAIELLLGAWGMGATVLPLHPGSTPREITARLTDAGATRLFDDPRAIRSGVDGSDPIAPHRVEPTAIALLLYTSGTSGRPKGVPISHANALATIEALHGAWRWTPDDVLVHALPLFHVHGLIVAQLGALYAGATTVWVEPFSPAAVLDALAAVRGRPALFMGVPTHYARLIEAGPGGRDLSGVRLFTSGSAGLPASAHAAFERAFGHRILERYGMTETGIVLSNRLDARDPGRVGFPLPGVRARIADDRDAELPDGVVGELQIAGPSVFAGYLNAPEASAVALAGGWMHTGDLAIRDPDGAYRIAGRRSEMILSGGMNVWPAEVEEALLDAGGIAEVAVFGLPDADLGERVAAAVVPRGDWDPDALLAAARERLAPYKLPRRWFPLDALPRNAMGKVERPVLRARYEVVVRPARADDLDGIVARNLALCEETEDFSLDPDVLRAGVQRALGGSVGARYLIAERAGDVVGQLMLTTEWSDWRDAEVWWIQSVYVAPDHRRTGVYRALHDDAVARARARGAAGLRLYVETRNRAAMRTYERAGMVGGHYEVYEQLFARPATRSGDPA